MNNFINCLYIPVFIFVFYFGYMSDSYILLYFSLCVFLLFSIYRSNGFIKVVALFFTFYLSIGMLNISSWRGYIDTNVIFLYSICILSFFIFPFMFLNKKETNQTPLISNERFLYIIIFSHVLIAFLAVMYTYISIGNVIIYQSLRFKIPTAIEYTIKSILPIAALIPMLHFKRKMLLLVIILLPAILIGSRGTAVIAVVSFVISEIYVRNIKLDLFKLVIRNKKYIFYAILCVIVITTGFYLRRGNGSDLAAVSSVLSYYFDYDNLFVRAILPFYLGFKETIGLTNTIINDNITNFLNPNTLFFADLYTVLPGENLAAGQTLGQIFGTVEGGGLTPGLVGGLFIDYGLLTIVFFMFFGLVFLSCESILYKSPLFIVIYSQVITQFIHLFHRGFLKPEYITSVLIAAFYYFFCHKLVFHRGSK